MTKRCAVSGCEVLLVGRRDLCEGHFYRLPQSQREILDKHYGAEPWTPNGIRYAAEIAASVHVLEATGTRPTTGLMGRGSGYPSGPEKMG